MAPEVAAALGAMPYPHIYPDPETRALRAVLAADLGVPAPQILVGCGADELIDLLMRAVLDPGDAIVDCPPTFTMYAFDAAVNGAAVITVPRTQPGFRLDVPGIEAAVRDGGAKVVFVTSPNNPDGSLVPAADLDALLRLPALVVLDEAYIEFAGGVPSRAADVVAHDNLVVLRTFSKSAGLAGLRVGYGAFPAGLAEYLWRAKQPYNVSVAAETAALAALSNRPHLARVRDALVAERGRLAAGLATIPWLTPYPSSANFILAKVGGGREAGRVRDALAEGWGIMVRHYAKADLAGYIRVSVGKPEHTDALVAALKEL
jgi:histidinol-phosphate aminotransferase